MSKIKILPQEIINLIAAGEVVERPASVIKEMMENSIDAKATRIIVKLENYGLDSIFIKDNGVGMSEEDAILAFKQHATSKLFGKEDLENLLTHGFRGEALASISSVAKEILVETKSENSDSIGLKITSTQIAQSPSKKADSGTTLTVKNLFENVPARKKFLKTNESELRHCIDTFIQIAIVYLDIHFELHHNDKMLYRLTQTSDIKTRLLEIFGEEIAKNVYVCEEFSDSTGSIKIQAVLGKSNIAKRSKAYQYTYYNNRFVNDKISYSAIHDAYKSFINHELKPVYFVFVHIDPKKVDVNVHPRKLEIRHSNPQEIYKLLYTYIDKNLSLHTKDDLVSRFSENLPETKTNYSYPKDNVVGNYNQLGRDNFSQKKDFGSVNSALSFTKALMDNSLQSNSQSSFSFNDAAPTDDFGYKIKSQIFNTYILVEKAGSLILVDQHAASEKILFEKLKSQHTPTSKALLVPEVLELGAEDKLKALELTEDLEKIGISISDFGGKSIQVTDIPEIIQNLNSKEFIEEIIEEGFEIDGGIKEENSVSKAIYNIIASLSCHGSIRAGQTLSFIEMQSIINDLFKIENPYNCPHGRPVFWEISKNDIEKNFRRKL